LLFVSDETLLMPFMTRDTVAVDTPASFATSFTVYGRQALVDTTQSTVGIPSPETERAGNQAM
jgi:hypothetical protein